jgi:hypothetical protein
MKSTRLTMIAKDFTPENEAKSFAMMKNRPRGPS